MLFALSPLADEVIINPDLGRSSTGALAIHASMIPTTTKVLLWGRIQPAYEPGMFTGDESRMPQSPGKRLQARAGRPPT